MTAFCIALPTDDGKTISPHFGRASRFVVFYVENSRVVAREERPKPQVPPRHSHEPGTIRRRVQEMVAPVRECRVLIVGGMGRPGYEFLTQQGYEVYLTGGNVEDAVQAYLAGQLRSDLRRLHDPHHHHHLHEGDG